MADGKHTPGPWEVRNGNVFAKMERYHNRPIARVGVPLEKNDSRVEELKHNAALISAAPELLEIAKVLLGHDNRFQVAVGGNPLAVDEMLAKARAALAKATCQRLTEAGRTASEATNG